MTRKEIAQARLKAASEHVENAQHELERAVSALGALQWMQPEQSKLSTLRDRIHEAFYRLAPISHARAKACAKAELDREPEIGDEDPHKGCCAGYAIRDLGEVSPRIALVCDAGCKGVRFFPKEDVQGHEDILCGRCSAPMVALDVESECAVGGEK